MTEAQAESGKRKRGAKKAPPRFSREQADVRRAMLIEAAARCLSVGGIGAFTVDRICKEAGVSRGLINHHFDSLDSLLIEVYKSSLYASVNAHIVEARQRRVTNADWPPEEALVALVRSNFSPVYFSRANLLIWLSLWGEIAVNPRLQAAHSELYNAYRAELAEDIAAVARSRGREVDAPALARNFIALVDGLWLEWCLDATVVTPEGAEAAGFEMLEARVGPLRKG
ncbi:TetR family transcriptional regulator C-terminal domain-containing protein [Mesorhizobium sp. PAMC28654]|uniref:TetR/AcrR family transcriptional regulator n=1 Tax=Mesorhizobium sp. PAMC28654 TaxID=2880934 RepID=UPI001D09B8AD|nr:TetR family transcriptional regulator C-terminal domain-containing protein [Mesorhizobium sp. PAMC28654]UDL91856.1 TetR family transcriptional regulator C-terminal domain-containing protein [Mesorhizobium sp. PAMC28654]